MRLALIAFSKLGDGGDCEGRVAATRKARVAVAVGARDGDGGRVVAADADGGVCDRGDCGEHERVS